MPENPQPQAFLLAIATELELRPILHALGISDQFPTPIPTWVRLALGYGCEAVVTGVGKANAAGGVARTLDPSRHLGVLNGGIAGLLPPRTFTGVSASSGFPHGDPLGRVVLATSSVYADEGVATPTGFQAFSDLGFPLVGESDQVHIDADWRGRLRRFSDAEGVIATVSTCSGTDAIGRAVHDRTGAIGEACEGAAAGTSAARLGVRFAELRVLSNTTGERDNQRWAMREALDGLGRVVAQIIRDGVLVGVGRVGGV